MGSDQPLPPHVSEFMEQPWESEDDAQLLKEDLCRPTRDATRRSRSYNGGDGKFFTASIQRPKTTFGVASLFALVVFLSTSSITSGRPPFQWSISSAKGETDASAIEFATVFAGPSVCSEEGENCRGTRCCSRRSQTCFAKNSTHAGCRETCDKSGTEKGWQCGQVTRSVACSSLCNSMGSSAAFPETNVIYLSDKKSDLDGLQKIENEYRQYVPCGKNSLRRVHGVDPLQWPHGQGRYDAVQKYGKDIPATKLGTSVWAGTNEGMIEVNETSPWWIKHNLIYAERNSRRESTWALKGFPFDHQCGISLSHFVTWSEARDRDQPSIIVAESDAMLEQWWQPYAHGSKKEFQSVVRAFLEEAPNDWDILFFDKGRVGVPRDATPRLSMSRECWQSEYEVYEWKGRGIVGAVFYMLSRRFLDKFAGVIHDVGMDQVDAWLAARCQTGLFLTGQFNCYTIAAGTPPKDQCESVCAFQGQVATCRQRMQFRMRHRGERCREAYALVHRQCDVCKGCVEGTSGICEEVSPKDEKQKGFPINFDLTLERQVEKSIAAESQQNNVKPFMEVQQASEIASDPCERLCAFQGRSATCGSRAKYVASTATAAGSDACSYAQNLVAKQCSKCEGCILPPRECLAPGPGSKLDALNQPLEGPPVKNQRITDKEMTLLCDNQCFYDGRSASCKERILFAAQANRDMEDPCSEAQNRVRQQCESCSHCELPAGICVNPTHRHVTSSLKPDNALEPVSTSNGDADCDAACSYGGSQASCRDRVLYAARELYGGSDDSCTPAISLVQQQCGASCPMCTIEKSKCGHL